MHHIKYVWYMQHGRVIRQTDEEIVRGKNNSVRDPPSSSPIPPTPSPHTQTGTSIEYILNVVAIQNEYTL